MMRNIEIIHRAFLSAFIVSTSSMFITAQEPQEVTEVMIVEGATPDNIKINGKTRPFIRYNPLTLNRSTPEASTV